MSRICLVIAIAALGIKTSSGQLARAGWKPFTLLLVETVWMAAFVLVAILSEAQFLALAHYMSKAAGAGN